MSTPIHRALDDMARKLKMDEPMIDITKIAHFALFGLLAVLLLWQNSNSKPSFIIADIFMFACGTELVQLYSEGRSALLTDIVIDMAGCGAGMLLIVVARRNKLTPPRWNV